MTQKTLWIALAVALLLKLPAAGATELQRPYICKEWAAVRTKAFLGMPEKDYNSSLLLAWVDGWSEGYHAAHKVKDSDRTWLLNRFLNAYCVTHPGETLSAALNHIDFEQVERILSTPGLSLEDIATRTYETRKR